MANPIGIPLLTCLLPSFLVIVDRAGVEKLKLRLFPFPCSGDFKVSCWDVWEFLCEGSKSGHLSCLVPLRLMWCQGNLFSNSARQVFQVLTNTTKLRFEWIQYRKWNLGPKRLVYKAARWPQSIRRELSGALLIQDTTARNPDTLDTKDQFAWTASIIDRNKLK